MKSNKKLEMRYIILIVLGISALMLGLITSAVKDNRQLNPIEKSIKDSVLLIGRIVYAPITWVNKQIIIYNEKQDLYNKYKALQKQVSLIKLKDTKNIELEYEIKKLKEVLKLNKTLSESSYLNATVINRNLGYWYNTLTLDKGSNSGIKTDMAVITGNGLIGKIIKTTNFNSTVKLLTSEDVNNKISIKIKVGDTFIYGLLTGYDLVKQTFIIEGIADNINIPVDSVVMTTGLGGLFPSGILIGTVESFEMDNFGLAKTVSVKSSVDFNDISYVTILKRVD